MIRVTSSLLLVLLSLAVRAQWTNLDAGTNIDWYSVHFADADHGIVSGEFLGVAITHDGGLSWSDTLLAPSGAGQIFYDCWMVNPDLAFAAGSGGKVYRTEDGGNSWELLVSVTLNPIFAILFLDYLNGYISGSNGTLYYTEDGGDSWSNIPNSTASSITGLHFFSAGEGQAVGDDGRWFRVEGNEETETRSILVNEDFTDLIYLDDLTGYACAKGSRVLARTVDGGDNWSQVPLGFLTDQDWNGISPYPPGGVAVVGSFTSPISGEDGYVRIGPDGGWSGNDFSTVLRDIWFPAADTGYICGNDGFMAKTTEGISTSVIEAVAPEHIQIPNPISDWLLVEDMSGPALLVATDGSVYELDLQTGRADVSAFAPGTYLLTDPDRSWVARVLIAR